MDAGPAWPARRRQVLVVEAGRVYCPVHHRLLEARGCLSCRWLRRTHLLELVPRIECVPPPTGPPEAS